MIDNLTQTIAVQIPAGETGLSGPIDLKGCSMVAIKMPHTWATADLTFLACEAEGGTYYDVYDDASTPAEVVVPVAADRTVVLPTHGAKLSALRYIKIRSGTAAVPVNQAGSPTLYLLCKA
jgi:hypothetical protein